MPWAVRGAEKKPLSCDFYRLAPSALNDRNRFLPLKGRGAQEGQRSGRVRLRYINRIRLGMADAERRDLALAGIEGMRLTYRRINEAGHA